MFNRLAVKLGRFEHIAHHRLKRGILKDWLSTNEFRIVRLAVFSNRNQDNRRASYVAGFSDSWIDERAGPDHLKRLKLRLLNRRR